jgi:hypothetical protein
MRKGLVITLGVVALVLVVSPGFATAPIITCVPDIIVSDFEDSQTQDNDLFIFRDAIDLDTHVTDADTDPALLRWSFIQSSGPNIEINDIGSNTSGDVVAPGAFDIRAVSNLITVRNVDWSPLAEDPGPYTGPPSEGDQADSMIELYVSDGTNTGSQTVTVTSVDEVPAAGPFPPTTGGDRLVPQAVVSYTFNSNNENWTQFLATNPGVVADATLSHNATAGSLDMQETAKPAGNTEVVFGAWESPKDPAVAPNPRFGCILRARFQVSSNVDGATCPGFRTRALTTHVMDAGGGMWIPDFLSQDLNTDLTVNYFTPDIAYVAGREPGTAGKAYDMLSWPQQIDSLMATSVVTYVTADLLDLDRVFSDDVGIISVDQVDIDGISRPADGSGRAEAALSFSGNFDTWTESIGPVSGGTHVAPSFASTAAEIVLNVQPGAAFFDASSVSPAVALDVGRYYRITFTVSSSATPGGDFGPTFRLGMGSSQFSFSADKNLQGGGLLSAIGSTQEPFEVWMQAPPATAAQTEPLFVRFQSWLLTSNTGFPFNKNVSGTIRCHEVVTESFDPPN